MKQILFICLSICWFTACVTTPSSPKEKEVKEYTKEELFQLNKDKYRVEHLRIKKYLERRGLENFELSNTGLRYSIYEKNVKENLKVENGQTVTIQYVITLLNGTEVYRSGREAPDKFKVGRSDVESGLHEGVTYMKKGEKAILIIPSYLAFGLAGDLNKIPGDATIIYDIEILDIEK